MQGGSEGGMLGEKDGRGNGCKEGKRESTGDTCDPIIP